MIWSWNGILSIKEPRVLSRVDSIVYRMDRRTMTSKVDLWSPWPWCPTQTTSGSSCTQGSYSDSTVEKWPSKSSSTCCSCCSRCTSSSLCLHGIPKERWDQSGWRSTSYLQRRAGSTAFHCSTGQLFWNIFSRPSTCKGSFTGWQQGSSLHPRDWRSGLGLLGSCSLHRDPSFEAQASSKGATATAPIVEASEEYRTRNLRRVQFSLTIFSRCFSSIWKLRLGSRLQSRCGSLGVAAVQMNVQKNGDAWWCMVMHGTMHGDAWWCTWDMLFASFCILLPLASAMDTLQSQGFMRCQHVSTCVNMCQHVSTLPCFWGTFFWDHESLGSKLHGICCIQLSRFLQDFLLQEEIERERERWNLRALDPSKPVAVSMAFQWVSNGFPWVPPSKIRPGPWLANVQVSESVKSVRRNESDEKKSQCLNYYHGATMVLPLGATIGCYHWVLPWCYHGATFA